MKRRDFIWLLGGAAFAAPPAARAQQPKPAVVGFLGSGARSDWAHLVTAFHQGLSEAGFTEGQNVLVEHRWAEGRYDRLPAFAAEFSNRPVAVIAAASLPAALAAKAATTQVPVVFASGGDPVADGLVTSLNRPGANVTGVTNFFGELGAKRLELLREIAPAAALVAVLVNTRNPNANARLTDVENGARAMGQRIRTFDARTAEEIDAAFDALTRDQAKALLLIDDPFFVGRREHVVRLAARHALPAVYYIREFAASGGLMAYGISFIESYRQFGGHVARVLKGARPGDLPVLQPTKFELVINLRTAKALGLVVPPTLLARADEVIE
jgi:putative ABC transport system substrate-binding protein